MSSPDSHSVNIEDLKPCLIAEVEFIHFKGPLYYLKNKHDKTFLKLTEQEAGLVRSLDGQTSISDILHKNLEAPGAIPLKRILDLLIELNARHFLKEDQAALLRNDLETLQPGNSVQKLAKSMLRLGDFTIMRWPERFNSRVLRAIAGALVSPVFLSLCAVMAVLNLFCWPQTRGVNIFQGFLIFPGTGNALRYGDYILSLACIWGAFSIMLSLKNIFSAYVLSFYNCEVINPRIRFLYSLVFFDACWDDIIRAGVRPMLRLFAARIVFPLVLMLCFSSLWLYVFRLPLLLLLGQSCIVITFFSVSPLFRSDFTRILGMIKTDTGTTAFAGTFLIRKFLVELLSLRRMDKNKNHHVLLSILSILWLYLFYEFLWWITQSSLALLIVDFINGPLLGKIIIAVFLGLLLVPLAILALSSIVIALLNLKAVARSPLRRLAKSAAQLRKRTVPAAENVIAFLRQIPLFAVMTENDLADLCRNLQLRRFGPRQDIVVQGEKGDTFYVIVSGSCSVIAENAAGHERILDILDAGDSFGEIALLENIGRTATVRSIKSVALLELGKKDFDRLVIKSAGGKEKITDIIRLGKTIINIPLFSFLTPSQMNALIGRLKSRDFRKADVIVRQNEPGDRFYLVKEGGLLVERCESGKAVFRKMLGKGDFFGEIALIKNIGRTATVTAETSGTLLFLTKDDFREFISASLLTGAALDTVAQERMSRLGKEVLALCS